MTTPSAPSKYALTFSLNVLNHLGIGLYSNIPAVLSEMVANAWDAGATLVNIEIGAELIIIEDNGRGLSTDEINDRYLRVGYQKRKNEATVRTGRDDRHVMGRKGIGKLAAFSIANIVEVQTSKDGVKNGFVMSLDAIAEGVNRGELQYSPQELSADQLTVEVGTKTVLRDIKQSLLDVGDKLRTELARRFSIISADRSFDVIINGNPISLKDRNYYDKR
jgi:HSP90 family molecular chaperone